MDMAATVLPPVPMPVLVQIGDPPDEMVNTLPVEPDDAESAETTRFVCAWRLKFMAPVVGERRAIGCVRMFVKPPLRSTAFRMSPGFHV